jgi:hypothetical protein
LPGSIEWQAWHFLNTSRPAAASPSPDGRELEEVDVVALVCAAAIS